MNEAIEHAAQAAYEAVTPNDPIGWAKQTEDHRQYWRIAMTAGIKSLRNPTRTMMQAGDFIIQSRSQDLTTKLFQALIDKATAANG